MTRLWLCLKTIRETGLLACQQAKGHIRVVIRLRRSTGRTGCPPAARFQTEPSVVRGFIRHGLLACICLVCVGAVQAEDANEPGLLKQLKALDERAAQTKDLSAKFEQRRHTPLLKKPITSRGTLRALPGRSRWDTDDPFSSVMMIERDRLSIYYPEDGVLEIYPLQAKLGQFAASPLTRLSAWQKHFTLAVAGADALSERLREDAKVDDKDRPCLLVRLTLRDDELAKTISSLVVVIDAQTGLTRAMVWSGQEGERTEVVFHDVRTDTGLEEKDLVLDTPEETRVVYPLGPVKPVKPASESAQ